RAGIAAHRVPRGDAAFVAAELERVEAGRRPDVPPEPAPQATGALRVENLREVEVRDRPVAVEGQPFDPRPEPRASVALRRGRNGREGKTDECTEDGAGHQLGMEETGRTRGRAQSYILVPAPSNPAPEPEKCAASPPPPPSSSPPARPRPRPPPPMPPASARACSPIAISSPK